jgi:glucose-1-phosphate thymidylyltransferase
MRGVVLCGGNGTRLGSLTKANNKHLLPVYDKPMCFYPIETLVSAGINEIMIIVSGEYAGNFIKLLKNGEEFGLKTLVYAYQSGNGGIADALKLAKTFANGEDIAVILGDNTTDTDISFEVNNFIAGAHIFLKEVSDPQNFGVPTFGGQLFDEITDINEKPDVPASNYAITGLYLYDHNVFNYIDQLKPSARGEMEISEINQMYLKNDKLTYSFLEGFWKDAGNPENLLIASNYWAEKKNIKNPLIFYPLTGFSIIKGEINEK